MRHLFQSFSQQSQKTTSKTNRKTLGLVMGLVVASWLTGSMILGSINVPGVSLASPTKSSDSAHASMQQHVKEHGFAEIAKSVTPAVVNITAQKVMNSNFQEGPFDSFRDFFGKPGMPSPPQEHFGMGSGSGVIVSPDGHIVTNFHVVDGAKTVTVMLVDKREFTGTVVGTDPQTDLAILKIDAKDLPYLKWGNISELQVGDYVLAVGNPFGLSSTVTQGIVSALGRGGMGITQYEDFIQTDAAINPGNSGGALVNTQGELIGINTAIFSRTGGSQGVGFAIPASMAQPVFDSLVKNGKVVRGYLGVGIQELTSDLAKTLNLDDTKGALVTDVRSGSPAEGAGLQRGDTIVMYQGVAITNPRTLQREVTRTPVDTSVDITIMRDGEEQKLSTKISEHPDSIQLASVGKSVHESALAGVKVQDLDQRLAQTLGVKGMTEGVVVTYVEPGSQAERAGLVRGDIISEINKEEIHSLREYQEVVSELTHDKLALVLVHRNGNPLFLTIKV
ncbi:MAG: DegQ family serine endoprotease [Nitrospirales bacterium]|nr:DegQ family serine endoprotease [Nitrospira sp.]MDR4502587.1 DegQ family serine endoprotease [Nitrospirales bacterium]